MVPQTLGALVAFLALVAPGIVFELLRERRRAGRKESGFREAARIALGSLGFSLLSCLLLAGLHAIYGAIFAQDLFVNLEQFAADPSTYARQHQQLILVSVLAELVLACLLAFALDFVLARRGHEITSIQRQNAWQQVFRGDRPPESVPWVHVHLTDGTSFFGFLRSHAASGNPDEREIVLEGPELTYLGRPLDGSEAVVEAVISERWPRVVIPASQIKYMRVQYRDIVTSERVAPRRRGPQRETLSKAGD